jgi:hypothetical protein
MILFMWTIIFVVVFIPGGLVGWLIGLTPVPTGLQWTLLVEAQLPLRSWRPG